jgi:hypothetical protein
MSFSKMTFFYFIFLSNLKLRPDEKWIFNMFTRGDNDQSPNAHACRLKLISGVLFSLNEVPWEIAHELEKYLSSMTSVSSGNDLEYNRLQTEIKIIINNQNEKNNMHQYSYFSSNHVLIRIFQNVVILISVWSL